jgi:hypothetical protein
MSIIRNGQFIKDAAPEPPKLSPEWKRWNLTEQRRTHLGDIQQRYVNGKPNPAWIRMYGEEAKAQFTEQEVQQYGNEYGTD